MARFLPKLRKFSNGAIKTAVMWGLLIFYSVIIVAYYGLKLWKSTENFDVADARTGNLIVLDSQYASTMPSVPLADVYSFTADPVPIAAPLSKIAGNSNTYTGSPGYIGGGTLGTSSVSGNVSVRGLKAF
jgi:hypothetical protein